MPLSTSEIRNLYDQVKEFLDQGAPTEAKQLLDAVPLDSSDDLMIEYLQGVCEQELGNHDRAIKRFSYVISMEPSFTTAAEALIHLHPESLTEGQLKYLYELIMAEKPRVSQQTSAFLQIHEELDPEPLMDFSKNQTSTATDTERSDDHFADSSLTASEPAEGSDGAENHDLLNERTQEAMDDPDSLIDPMFAEHRTGEAAPEAENAVEEVPVMAEETTDIDLQSEVETEAVVEEEMTAAAESELPVEEDVAVEAVEAGESEEGPAVAEEEAEPIPEAAAEADDLPDETPSEEEITVAAVPEVKKDAAPKKKATPKAAPAKKEAEAAAEKTDTASPEADEDAREASGSGRISIEENKLTGERIVRVETFTMAEIYIKQGLYHEALQILTKLREKAEDTEKIDDTIHKVTQILEKEKV